MNRKVSQKAQKMANAYVQTKAQQSIKDGQEFDIYTNGRFYTFSFQSNRWGSYSAKFEHYGRKYI